MPKEPLELERDIRQASHHRIVVDGRLEARLAGDRLRELDRIGRIVGHHLRQHVDLVVGHLQHAPDIAQDRTRLQGPESNDLGHLVGAVFILHVADHLVAPILAEIDVEVRHGDTLGVEEALEQEAETERIQIRDGERPGGHGAGARTPARADRNAVRLGPFDEIGDDQEVAGVVHADDDVELEFEPLAVGCLRLVVGQAELGEARLQSGPCLGAQLVRLRGAALGELGQDGLAHGRADGAAFGDDQRVVDRFGQVGEQRAHLLGALEAVLGSQPAALLLPEIGAVRDAHQGIVGQEHVRLREEGFVGGDQRHIERIGKLDGAGLDSAFAGHVEARNLGIEPARIDRCQTVHGLACGLGLALAQKPADGARGPARERDEPGGVRLQRGPRDVGDLAGRDLQKGAARKRQQVRVAVLVLRQQNQPIGRRAAAVAFGRGLRPFDPERAADDRLHAGRAAGLGKLQRAEHVAAIGDRQRRHVAFLAERNQVLDLHRPFEQRIGGVHPEMGKIGVAHDARQWRNGILILTRPARMQKSLGPICCGLLFSEHTIL